MEKFFSLKKEKQEVIINAALEVFGRHGYQKASVNDIAVAAHISKASVFQYFGSKKNLYCYLIQYSKELMMNAFNKPSLDAEHDLFDRILSAAVMKVTALKRYPALTGFIFNVWKETAEEVQDVIAAELAHTGEYRKELVLRTEDELKFRHPEDAQAVLHILVMMSEGFVAHCQELDERQLEKMMDELKTAIAALRKNFYKEEFLQ